MNDKITLENTILEPYENIILDVDGVIFDCFTSAGKSIGCYMTEAPYEFLSPNIVKDIKGNIIRLQEHLRSFLEVLDDNDINLGICSRGEKENTPFAAQPTVMLLKKFNIYKYFTLDVILKSGINKGDYVKAKDKTLFIDDMQDQLDSVVNNENVDTLNRKSFSDWLQLIEPKIMASLSLNILKISAIQELRLG